MKLKEFCDLSYRSHWQNGMYWLEEATTLKVAADKIFDVWQDACQRDLDLNEEDEYLITDEYIITIYRERELRPVYMLLIGYALENLVKGIIISEMRRENPDSIDKANLSDLRLPWKDGIGECELTRHEFQFLFNTKFWNMKFSNQETRLLKEIEECVTWGGKYPIPKKHKGLFIPKMGLIVMDFEFRTQINALYDKFNIKLREVAKLE